MVATLRNLISSLKDWWIADYLLALMLLVFPVYNRLMPILLILLGLTLLLKRRSFNEFRASLSWKNPSSWFIIYFCAHLIGLIYSTDLQEGINDVGMKLSLLAMPVILNLVTLKLKWSQLANLTIIGLFIACLVAYSKAIYMDNLYVGDGRWGYYTESYFIFFMHRSYFAVYLVMGVVLVLDRWNETKKYIYLIPFLVFTAVILQSLSKAGIILYVLTIPPMMIYFIYKKYGWLKTVLLAVGILLVGVVVISRSNRLTSRFEKMFSAFSGVQTENNMAVESNASRVIMWSTSLELFQENLLVGVGTGDVSKVINDRNIEKGNLAVAQKNLNSHNQFLNSAVQLGLMGLLPLLMIFIIAIWKGMRYRSKVLVLASIIFGVSMLFESSFERQEGVMPITMLILLFGLYSSQFKTRIVNERD